MTKLDPAAELQTRFSSPDATPTPWAEARTYLESAEVFWLSTVRTDGRPHVTPLISVWVDDVLYFCTGSDEQKAQNLASNPHCILTTGCNAMGTGFDLVVEGDAQVVTDDAVLQRLADVYESKYGSDWHFEVRDGAFHHDAGSAIVFAVPPVTAYGYDRGNTNGATRWRFS